MPSANQLWRDARCVMPQQKNPPAQRTTTEGGVQGEAAGDGQSHPLYSQDRQTVDRLLAAETPSDGDLVDAARLLSRYEGFPGAFDLQSDLERAIRLWGLNRESLQARTRALWQGGYRPGAGASGAEPVGSGFDASSETGA
ncbi:MAG: hypothetical protein RLZZ609_152 [Cyanobacteriota bacterium]|jgi:hypothetical protein